MSRFLFFALALGFLGVVTDKHPVLVQSSEHIARQAGARGVVRCTYFGPRGLIEDEYRVSTRMRDAPPSCPMLRPRKEDRNA
jgi:hypothetical protein